MTSKLTREERIQSLYDLKIGQVLNQSDIESIKMLARMALAAMDSEPVAYTDEDELNFVNDMACMWTKGMGINEVPLYRHAQQPVVPEEKPMPNTLSMYAVDAVAAIAEVKGWNACRAAMLNHPSSIQPNTDAAPGAEIKHPSSNSPVIPEGYVMVPKEPTKEMIDAGWLYFMGTKNPSSKGAYKAMLAAAPQEPKS
ncbi:hypothetical protein [Klebsiella michiganensis]|uniref:hypothetical protein n=1 Tax=Klebsiella michiganensis TaxID=1134687 RepID=UPI0034D2885B